MAGAAGLSGFQGVAARARPGRQLPAGTPLLHRGGHPSREDAQCREYEAKGHESTQATPGMIGIAEAMRIEDVGGEQHEGEREDQAAARLGGRPGQRPAACRGRRPRQPGRGRCGGDGRDVSGERGQVGAGLRGERPARSRVEFRTLGFSSARAARTSSGRDNAMPIVLAGETPACSADIQASPGCDADQLPALEASGRRLIRARTHYPCLHAGNGACRAGHLWRGRRSRSASVSRCSLVSGGAASTSSLM